MENTNKIKVTAIAHGFGSRMYRQYETVETIRLIDLKDENGNDLLPEQSFKHSENFKKLFLKKGDKISFTAIQKKTLSDILKLSNPTSINAYRG